LKHDIDYLIASGNSMATIFADMRAVNQTNNSLESWFMRLGLTTRTLLGLPFNTHKEGNKELGLQLKRYVKGSQNYREVFSHYGVTLADW